MGTSFALSKWYMDCIAEDGEALIAGAAHLRLGGGDRARPLELHHASTIHHAGGHTTTRSTLRRAMPAYARDEVSRRGTLNWDCRGLGVRGRWESDAPELSATIFAAAGGSVEWRCLMPRAGVVLDLEGGRSIFGTGYVEEISLSVAPWELPLKELRCGRFTSATGSVVWIDWLGAHHATFVYVDGVRSEATMTERTIELDVGHLDLHEPTVVRAGVLVDTVLASVADLVPLPPDALKIHESKSICRGTLHRAGERIAGWAIHESIIFSSPPR